MVRLPVKHVLLIALASVVASQGCSRETPPANEAVVAAPSTPAPDRVGVATPTSTAPRRLFDASSSVARIDVEKLATGPTATPQAAVPAPIAPAVTGPTLLAANMNTSEAGPEPLVAQASRTEAAAQGPTHTPADFAAAAQAAVERNGPIFHEWPKPKYVFVFTGDLTGYIEPCGCAGLENLKGGLSRRDSLLAQFEKEGWPYAAFDLGGQVRRVGVTQTEIKFQQTVKGLIEMGYAAVGFGADDLRMQAASLLGAATEPYQDKTATFTSANVGLFAFDSGATQRFRTTTVAGRKIGVTAVLGEAFRTTLNNDGIVSMPAEQALAEIMPQLIAERCDDLILLSYASPAESEALARKFPQFKFVVTTGGADEPPGSLPIIPGMQTRLIEVGKKGQHAIVLGFFDEPQQPVRYQRVALDARFPESPAMKQLMVEYQDQLRLAGWSNLGITEKIHPRFDAANPLAAKFVGSESCAKCHEDAYAIWKDSGHAHALETLVRLDPPRQYDAECLSCHTVGWDPQNYVPFQGGFSDVTKTPQLFGNGCENCHGPGGAHVAAEAGADEPLKLKMRSLMHLSLDTVERTTCVKCHDHDNSPAFKFEEYWPQIEH